jgi:hypothetical protein
MGMRSRRKDNGEGREDDRSSQVTGNWGKGRKDCRSKEERDFSVSVFKETT